MEYITIIPNDVDLSQSHQYLRLPHPRTNQPQLYLPYETPGGNDALLEIARLNGSHRRTWFIGDTGIDSGTLLVHYQIDPLFIIIPLVLALIPNGSLPPFQPLQDLLSAVTSFSAFSLPPAFASDSKGKAPATETNEDINRLLKLKSIQQVFKACCERKSVPVIPPSHSTDSPSLPAEKYYRPSMDKVIQYLKKKVQFFAQEEECEKFDHLVRSFARDGLLDKNIDDELLKLAKLKAACEHLSQWLPLPIHLKLLQCYDFTLLNIYLVNRNTAALAVVQPNTVKEKKAPKGMKKKAPTSKGVEALKKVNTSNMKKLTNFFISKDKK
ncbi:hypothetical protein L204_100113 [Cryptococcus depauperatus]